MNELLLQHPRTVTVVSVEYVALISVLCKLKLSLTFIWWFSNIICSTVRQPLSSYGRSPVSRLFVMYDIEVYQRNFIGSQLYSSCSPCTIKN